MELELERSSEFHIGDNTSPESLTFLSRYGLLVVSETNGHVGCYEPLLGQKLTSYRPLSESPTLAAQCANKLVICNGENLGVRSTLNGRIQLDTIFQSTANDPDTVVNVEVPHEEVLFLLNELKSKHFSAELQPLVNDLLLTLEKYKSENIKQGMCQPCLSSLREWKFCILSGPIDSLYSLFNKLCSPYQPSKSGSTRRSDIPAVPPVVSILSAIRFRLHLMHPSHTLHICGLEVGTETLSNNDISLMYAEGMRRISFHNWPHKNYLWAEPIKMAEAGLYPLLNTAAGPMTAANIPQSKMDRTTCFTCGMYVHRWLPSDEPWSEHTRHSHNCPFVRGEHTVNVPTEFTESTHCSVKCAAPVDIISTSYSTSLVAIATSTGKIQVWDTGNSLYVQEYAFIDLEMSVNTFSEDTSRVTTPSDTPPLSCAPPTTPPPIPPKKAPTSNAPPTSDHLFSKYIQQVFRTTAVSIVTMETTNHQASSMEAVSCPPSLIVGCTCLSRHNGLKDFKLPALIVYSLIPNSLSTAGSNKQFPPKPVDGDSLYELLMSADESSPTIPSTGNKSFPDAPPLTHPRDVAKSPSTRSGTALFVDCVYLMSYVISLTDSCFPCIRQIVQLRNLIILNVDNEMEKENDEDLQIYGALVVFELVENDNNQITVHKYQANGLRFASRSDCIIDISCFTYTASDGSVIPLLAAVTVGGRLKIYDKHLQELVSTDECNYVRSVFCEGLNKIAAACNDGYIKLLNIKEDNDMPHLPIDTGLCLTEQDLVAMEQLMSCDPNGLSFTGVSQPCWVETNPLRYYQHSPRHMFQVQNKRECYSGLLFNTKIWKYLPRLSAVDNDRHVFKLHVTEKFTSISFVKFKLNFATPSCISDTATVNLAVLKSTSNEDLNTGCTPQMMDMSQLEILCGPILIKPFLDVTDLSITLTLSHLQLLQSHQSILYLIFDNLFVGNYSTLTEEASKDVSSKKTDAQTAMSDFRYTCTMRSRLVRRNPPPAKPVTINHCTILVTLFPYYKPLCIESRCSMLSLIVKEEFIYKLIVHICCYRMDKDESLSLPEALQLLISNGSQQIKVDRDGQLLALNSLCWIISVVDCHSDRSCFNSIRSVVSNFLMSLFCTCFFSSDRSLSHKCSHLISILTRNRFPADASADMFVSRLSQTFLQLIPLLSLVPTAGSLHLLLYQLVHYCQLNGTAGSDQYINLFLKQLIELSQEQINRDTQLTQILQTDFHKSGSVFDTNLFDISFHHSLKTPPARSLTMPASSTAQYPNDPVTYVDFVDDDDDFPSLPPPTQAMKVKPFFTSSKANQQTAKQFGIGRDDSEFLLLLKGKEEQLSSSGKNQKELKHGGSHVMNGLLETFPLSYSNMYVSSGATVRDQLTEVKPDLSWRTDPLLIAYLNVHQPMKHLGYMFHHKTENQSSLPATPIHYGSSLPVVLSNLTDEPKEMCLHIESLKPGSSYSTVIDFGQPIVLTDIFIHPSSHVFSISINIWLNKDNEEAESQTIVQSTELSTHYLILSNLLPPPVIQYARLTFIGNMNSSSEKCVVALGQFYGKPILKDFNKPLPLLLGLESKLKMKYHKQLQELSDVLSMYKHNSLSSVLTKQLKKQVLTVYQSCFNAQVNLSRVSHLISSLKQEREQSELCSMFTLDDMMTSVMLSQLSANKLSICISSIVESLLVLVQCSNQHSSYLTKSNCKQLFLAVNIHGRPSVQARFCALLIILCGKQIWWSEFISELFSELFSSNQTVLFDKERVLLQFSALCQRTLIESNVLEKLLSLLDEQIVLTSSNVSIFVKDPCLVQWLVLLVSSVLSSSNGKLLSGNETAESQKFSSLFDSGISEFNRSLSLDHTERKLEKVQKFTKSITDCLSEINKVLADDSTRNSAHKDSLLNLKSDLSKKLVKLNKSSERIKKYHRKLNHRSTELSSNSTTDASSNCSTRLSPSLVSKTGQRLSYLLVKYCQERNWYNIPTVCKVLLSLLSISSPFITLHKEQLEILISSMCIRQLLDVNDPASSSDESLINYKWACHGIQTFLVSLLLKEKKEMMSLVDATKESDKDKELEKIFQKMNTLLKSYETASTLSEGISEIDRDHSSSSETCTDDTTIKTDGNSTAQQEMVVKLMSDLSENIKPLLEEPSDKEGKSTISIADIGSTKTSGHVTPGSSDHSKPKLVKKTLKKSISSTSLLSQDLHHPKSIVASTQLKDNTSATSSSSFSNVSNTIDSRFLSNVQLPAELHLQVISRDIYKVSLEAIQFAKPIVSHHSDDDHHNVNTTLNEEMVTPSLPDTLLFQVLLNVLEETYAKSSSVVDIHNLLMIWNDFCCVSLKSMKRRHLLYIFSSCSLFSTSTINSLLDLLLNVDASDSQLCYTIMSLLHNYAKISYKVNGEPLDIDIHKLTYVLCHCCNNELLTSPDVQHFKDHNVILGKFLTRLGCVFIKEEKGVCLLLNILVKVLQERPKLSLSQNLSTLVHVLQQQSILEQFFSSPDHYDNMIHSIKEFLSLVISLLSKSVNPTTPQVNLFGSVADSDRGRRFYYSAAISTQEMKWVELQAARSSQTGGNMELLVELVKLAKAILNLTISSTDCVNKIIEYCSCVTDHTSDHTHKNYSSIDKPLVNLVLNDTHQLTELCLALSSAYQLTDSSKGNVPSINLLNDFIKYLCTSCNVLSCFRKPLLTMMESCYTHKGPSSFILNILEQFSLANHNDNRKLDNDQQQMDETVSFITQGGASAVINCLITSVQISQATPTSNKTNISNIGTQEFPLPYKDGTQLINFFPLVNVKTSPVGPSMKELQSVNLKDAPGRGSAFQYTFSKDVQWIKIYVSLNYTILLHEIHLYQPAGLTQNGPALVKVEVSRPSNLGKPIPLTPPMNTTGLTGIKLELTSPVIVNEVWLHLHKPIVTESLLLSNLLLLGTMYGCTAATSKQEKIAKPLNTTVHPSEGWLSVISKWLTSYPQVAHDLNSIAAANTNLVPTCISLLKQSLRYVTMETVCRHGKFSPLATKQLQSFLLSVSGSYPEIGDQLVLLLIRSQFNLQTTPPGVTMATGGCGTNLLLELCSPETSFGQRRLLSSIKVLSDLTSVSLHHLSSTHSLSMVLCTLSHSLWIGKQALQDSTSFNDELSDELFKSLLNVAISQEVGSPLKWALNSLQTSLCRLHPPWFYVAIETASKLLQNEYDCSGNVLHTIAQCSLSDECIRHLLESTLLKNIINKLVTSLSAVKDGDTNTKDLSIICSCLAFLTDIGFGHRQAQKWLVDVKNAHFWPLLMSTFNEPSPGFSESELSFCQHTTQQFLAVCCKFNVCGKTLFVNLILNALSGNYSIEPFDVQQCSRPITFKLFPFLRTLLIDHLLGPEAVHMVVEIEDEFMQTIKGKIKLESIMPTYTSPHYHPSYPLRENCYYLKLSSEFTLTRLLSLLLFEEPQNQKTTTKQSEQGIQFAKKPVTVPSDMSRPLLHETRKCPQIDIFNFDIKMIKYSESPGKASTWIAFKAQDGDHEVIVPMTTKIRLIAPSKSYGCAYTRSLLVCKPSAPVTNSTQTTLISNESNPSMLEVFTSLNGLTLLAELFPHIYPGLWSCDRRQSPLVESVDLSMLPQYSPASFLPSHSYVMLGLCLRVQQYGVLFGEGSIRSNVWYILRGALGATEEEKQLSPSLNELLSFLPFLYLFHILKESSTIEDKGRRLSQEMYSVGIIEHLLQCLSKASHQQPRKLKQSNNETASGINQSTNQAFVNTSSTEKQYWAKGTGFGTGSTSSAWDINSMISQHQSDELLVSLSLAILAKWIDVSLCHEMILPDDTISSDDTTSNYMNEIFDLMERSCLLPTLASYLMNDSILDISKHTQVYKSVLELIISISTSKCFKPLVLLDVYEQDEHIQQPDSKRTISSLMKHLTDIALVYTKTIDNQNKGPDLLHSKVTEKKRIHRSPPPVPFTPPTIQPLQTPPISPPISTTTDLPPPLPPRPFQETEGTELSEVIELILKCGELVASISNELTTVSDITVNNESTESTIDYIESMRPLQFDTYQMIEEECDESSKVVFKIPYHYSQRIEVTPTLNQARSRRLAQEVTSLVSSLPLSISSSVFVRCDEDRMDIMKVLITGPHDTPYANGCFLFDIFFPPEYPTVPMAVNLCTTGHGTVRFNPNLYNDGKVCLSVLNTWHGRPEEKWNPLTSSFLQVLVSIQSLILVPEPYFNEPGYEQHRGTLYGDTKSLSYNANICIATIQWAMIDILKNPSPCFRKVIFKHFYLHQEDILKHCEKWKHDLADGIKRLHSTGTSTQSLRDYLKILIKQIEILKNELSKIRPTDIE